MRTVTFSDEKVAATINQNFIATWYNRSPAFHNCEVATEIEIGKSKGEAFATRNFCTFFVTPEQEVLHYMAGYYAPPWFLPEVELVLESLRLGYDKNLKPRIDGLGLAAGPHLRHRMKHEDQIKRIQEHIDSRQGETGDLPDSVDTTDLGIASRLIGGVAAETNSILQRENREHKARFEVNAEYAKEALIYLENVHSKLAAACVEGKPIPLSDVFRTYDAPNMFTEE